jgi:hypothetical protein
MENYQDFAAIMREAHAMRHEFIRGLLRRAWNAVFRPAPIFAGRGTTASLQ